MRRHWSQDLVFSRLVLEVEQETCTLCGRALNICDHRPHRIFTLQGPLELVCKLAHCPDRACAAQHTTLSPHAELLITLPGWFLGWDVFCWLGHRRFAHHWSVPQLRAELAESYQIAISADAIEVYLRRYQNMVAARQQDGALLAQDYQDVDFLILSIDGLQPEKGHKTLYVVRELMRKRVWFGEALLSSNTAEVRRLLAQAKDWAARLNKPIQLWLSDKQDAFVKGIAAEFPGTPHRYCDNHFLRDLAKPILQKDSHAKVQMRRKVRGLRAIEREILEEVRVSLPANVAVTDSVAADVAVANTPAAADSALDSPAAAGTLANTPTAADSALDSPAAAGTLANTPTAADSALDSPAAAGTLANTPTAADSALDSPAAAGTLANTPTAADSALDSPAAAGTLANTPTAADSALDSLATAGTLANAPTAADSALDSPAAAGTLANTPTAADSALDSPAAAGILANTPTAADSALDSPAAAGTLANAPTAADSALDSPAAAGTLANTPAAADSALDSLAAAGTLANTPTATDSALDSPAAAGTLANTPTAADSALDSPAAAGTLANTPTAALDKLATSVAGVVLDYCAAVRGILNDDQGGPLQPPGLRMAEALGEVRASLQRNLEAKKGGALMTNCSVSLAASTKDSLPSKRLRKKSASRFKM